jgi:hypothetical protein
MQTFLLTPQTENMSIRLLLNEAATKSLEVRDVDGKVVAYVLSPAEHEALIYADARRDIQEHRAEIDAARKRRGGVTTAELLEKARLAAERRAS